MLRAAIISLVLITIAFPAISCPVRLEMGLNQSGLKFEEMGQFNDSFKANGFQTEGEDPRFKVVFQLLKRKGHSRQSKKFAWGSVSVYDQKGKLLAYSFKRGPASVKDTKAYAQKSFDSVMNDLVEDLPACF